MSVLEAERIYRQGAQSVTDERLEEKLRQNLSPEAVEELLRMMKDDPTIAGHLGDITQNAEKIQTAIQKGREAGKEGRDSDAIQGVDHEFEVIAKGAHKNAVKEKEGQSLDGRPQSFGMLPGIMSDIDGIGREQLSDDSRPKETTHLVLSEGILNAFRLVTDARDTAGPGTDVDAKELQERLAINRNAPKKPTMEIS
jgi:hypothetical protein